MNRYNINKTKLVIIPLDGTIFDLNKFRYNYFCHYCKDHGVQLNKYDFYNHLSHMNNMYNFVTIPNGEDTSLLSMQIETELYDYFLYKEIGAKDGLIELVEYLCQKNIQIAVISTHRTKDAVRYLKSVKLHNKVQYIIGSDNVHSPLPSPEILETVIKRFKVDVSEAVVISSFMSLSIAAEQIDLASIYCEDLVKAEREERDISYKVVTNLFEVLNTFVFDKYVEADLYAPILGMEDIKTKRQLDQVHIQLQEKYKDDSQIIDLVDQTYEYQISQLTDEDNEEKPEETITKQHFTFDNDDVEETPIDETQPVSESIEDIGLSKQATDSIEDIEETSFDIHKLLEELQDEKDTDKGIQQLNLPIETKEDEIVQNDITVPPVQEIVDVSKAPLNTQEQEELNALLKQINKKEPEETNPIDEITEDLKVEDVNEDIIETKKEKRRLLVVVSLVNVLYIFAISFLILFVGLIIYIAFIHKFEAREGIFATLTFAFNAYYSIIENVFSTLFDSLHSIVNFIPSYNQYLTNNSFFSIEAVKLLNIFLFHSLIISVMRLLFFILRKDSKDEENL